MLDSRSDATPIRSGKLAELEAGSQHMFRYSTIRRLLEQDDVELI